ncbi:uncharacterized protein LOC136072270 [Hydra vulgaris]|uniref:uncharacterized protein LOC136072270 n=1 Tax=Hydra vulgaris TaxID=6087 RepID=UPI0032E9F863
MLIAYKICLVYHKRPDKDKALKKYRKLKLRLDDFMEEMRKTVSLLVSNSVTTGRVMLFIFLQLYCRLLKYKYYICFFFVYSTLLFSLFFSASFSGTTLTCRVILYI